MLDKRSEVLGIFLSQAGGEDMERCEQMYQSLWRSTPFAASELDSSSFSEFDNELRFKAASAQAGPKPSDTDEFGQADWYDHIDFAMQGIPSLLQQDTLLVTILNYKGEEVELALYDSNMESLPLYISKAYSAEVFNA